MSRAELTSLMGLNRSTIAGLVAELESLGISERALPAEGARQGAGRPSAGVRNRCRRRDRAAVAGGRKDEMHRVTRLGEADRASGW